MTPDVNVLVAAFRQDHPHHAAAWQWLEEALLACQSGAILSILPMVASGFLRLATHPKVFVQPTPPEDALAFLHALLSIPGVEMLPLSGEWTHFAALCAEHRLTGNAIPDAWIAASALHHHLHLITFDKGFRRFLKPGRLTVLNTFKA